MGHPRILAIASAAFTAVLCAYACGDGGTEPPPPPDQPRPTTVSVTPATAALTAFGETVQLRAEVRDQNGQVMAGAAVAWTSSNASVAAVDASGVVMAVSNGGATVTATAGSASGSAAVTVAQVIRAVSVVPAADTLVVADTLRLSAKATDANGHEVAGAEFAWASSDTLVVVTDEVGLVTGVGPGEVEVTATSSGVTGSAALAVVAQAPTTVTVTPDTVELAALGDTVRPSAEVRDQAGRSMEGVAVAWLSADTLVAVVDSAGLVTAVGNGTTTVTATAGPVSGSTAVTVAQAIRAVSVSPAADTLIVGDTLRLSAQATDANGHAVAGAQFAWSSSDTLVAAVGGSGLVRGIRWGVATITASTGGGAEGTADITVATPKPEEEACSDWAELRDGDYGEYLFLNNVWNKGEITDYEQCLMRRVVGGEDQYGWRWRWPYRQGEAKAYPQVIYGRTPWRLPTTTDLPSRISSLQSFLVDYELDLVRDGDIRVVFALWVTSTDPPTPESITHDIRIRVDRSGTGPPSSQGTQVNFDGVAFDVTVDPPSPSIPGDRTRVRFESHTHELGGTLKLHEFLDYLVDNGHLPASHYVTVVEMGTELISGSGELWIENYQVNVETAPPDEPPVAPSGVGVSRHGEDFIEWSWDEVAGAGGYHVWFSTDRMFTDGETASTAVPVYRKTGLDLGTTGHVRVRSVAGAGAGQLVSAWTMPVVGFTPPPNDSTPAPTDPTPMPSVEEACEDWGDLSIDGYNYLNNVWNKGTTTDYDQCVMRRVVDGRDEYGWRWRWPPPSDRVRAYPEVRYGWPPWHPRPTTSELPDRISSIRDLHVDYEAYMTADGVYNAAFSMWLTNQYPPAPEHITTEIMIWVDREWDTENRSLEAKSLIDHADIDGATFAVYVRPDHVSAGIHHTYVAFLSHTDRFSGTLDLKQFLDYLVERGIVSADDYVSDVELGNEVKHGTGELWLKRFEVTVR